MTTLDGYGPEKLVQFILTGFPLSEQRQALTLLAQRMAFSEMDVMRIAIDIKNANTVEEIADVIREESRRKNAPLAIIEKFLN